MQSAREFESNRIRGSMALPLQRKHTRIGMHSSLSLTKASQQSPVHPALSQWPRTVTTPGRREVGWDLLHQKTNKTTTSHQRKKLNLEQLVNSLCSSRKRPNS